MKKYAITSAKFSGEITYTYNDDGFLIQFNIDADLSKEQFTYILKYLPLTADEMQSLLGKSKSITITEIPFAVTFEMMWNKYNDKERSSKKKSLVKWDKMNPTDQVKAYLFIDKYNRKRGSAEQKYCETYLNAELWNN